MTHEQELKRPNGSRVRIIARIGVELYREQFQYDITVRKCAPRRRIWNDVINYDSYEYRKLVFNNERDEYIMKKQLEHVTAEEILSCKIALWKKLAP